MSGFNYVFDATQYAPEQGGGSHPIGKFAAIISATSIKPTKENNGGMFVVEFETEGGRISSRYNLWNQSQKAVDIAHKQLSALCHATGVFRVDMSSEGASLRGQRCMIEVGLQGGEQGEKGYTEVKKVFDPNGNEPGRPASAASAQAFQPTRQQPQAPVQPQQQPAQAWGAPAQAPMQQQASQAFQQAPQPAQVPQEAAAAPSWSQAPAPAQSAASDKPAWAR
jgi:hypothetical protein